MTRAGLAPGDIGDAAFPTQPNGKVLARVRYRRLDGQYGRISRVGRTKAEARRLAMAAARERMTDATDPTSVLTPDSTVIDVARAYIELQDERNIGNTPQYLSDERDVIHKFIETSAFGRLVLRRVTTGAVTAEHRRIKKTLGKTGRAAQWLTLTRKLLDLAAELDLVRENAARAFKTTREHKGVGFTPEPGDVWELRKLAIAYRDRPTRRGPKPTPLLIDTMDVINATGARIGEALGLRWVDIDLDAEVPRLSIVGTVVEGHGQRKHWQPKPKTKSSERNIKIPDYLVKALRRRQTEAKLGGHTFVFETRTGEPVGPHQVRVQLWKVRGWVEQHPDLDDIDAAMAMHALRRMVATEVTADHDIVVAARLSGHNESAITEASYAKRKRDAPDVRATTQRIGRPYGDDENE